jgi:FG-GAP repeat
VWLQLRGRQLLVSINAAGARYPVTIDPVIQQARLTASDGAANNQLGFSVAVSGDTIVAGAPFATIGAINGIGGNAGQGAAYVFVKPASGWANATETARLTASDGAANDQLGFSVAVRRHNRGRCAVRHHWRHQRDRRQRRDLLPERLPWAAGDRAAHPADPHPHQDPATVNGHVRRHAHVLVGDIRRRIQAQSWFSLPDRPGLPPDRGKRTPGGVDPSQCLNDPMAPAGYSNTPQARKIGLKPGVRPSLDHPPKGWRLADPPDGVRIVRAPEPADVIISFFDTAKPLPARLPGLAKRIFPNGMLWVAWPRRAGGHASDITDSVVRAHALPIGLVDVKIAALDEDWSGMRLVWRLENRSRLSPA